MTVSARARTPRSARLATLAVLTLAAALVAAPAHGAPGPKGPGPAPAPPPPPAPAVTCGTTVTGDLKLRADLRCPGTALYVEVPDGRTVTIELGGRSLVGSGTGSGLYLTNWGGSGAVVVRGGQIRGFESAVGGDGAIDVTFRSVTLQDNDTWLGHRGLRAYTVLVEDSVLIDTGSSGGYVDSHTTARRSFFVRSGLDSVGQTWTYAYDSTFVEGGIFTGLASNVVAEGNTFLRCDVGIRAQDNWPASPTLIRNNRFVDCGTGVRFDASVAGSGANAVRITGNQFLDGVGSGLEFSLYLPYGDFEISDNRAIGNGGTGISGTGAGGVTLSGNYATRNGGRGIDVSAVVDRGGNVAVGNGLTPQCVGVYCTSR